jgi:4-alpha-glucanotransferase
MIDKRASGILIHLTSLPGKHGIGDLGPNAFMFIDFVAASGQSYWQFLPTGPTSTAFDNSPYMCRSVFAGNPLLISLELLQENKYLTAHDLEDPPEFSEYKTDYPKVSSYKTAMVKKAFENFSNSRPSILFENFCSSQKEWLEDYALFMSFREDFNSAPWYEWPEFAARRSGETFTQYVSKNTEKLLYYKFVQFIFFSQWENLYAHAKAKNISL